MFDEDDKYFQTKRFKNLLRRYETAMEQSGTIYLDPDELTDIAEYYAMEGRMDDANQAIDLALALHPGSVDPQIFLARQQMFLDNVEQAYQLCNAIADQEDREVIFLRAELMLNEKRVQESIDFMYDIYRHLEDEDEPDQFLYDCATMLCDYAEWEGAYDMLMTLKEDYSLTQNGARRVIYILLEMGKVAQAIEQAEQHLDLYPFDAEIWTTRGEAYATQDNVEMAQESAEYALAITPTDRRALILAGNCQYQRGNHEEAMHYFSQVLQADAEDPMALFLLANCLSALDRCEEALDYFRRIDLKAPETPNMHNNVLMQCAMLEAKLGHRDNALRYEEELEQNITDDSFNLDIQRGTIHLLLGDTETAMTYFRQCLRTGITLQSAFDMPIQCIESGHVEEAIQLLLLMDDIYAGDEERERIAPMLAHCYYQTGDKPAFLRTFLRALQHEPALTADVFRIKLPNTNDDQELLRSAFTQILGDQNLPTPNEE
ncbi:MAG: tetratricopeptide repeat protein [Bacteroidaceae bacterium]|nr:tetratricopeptide repeat protein [Bacteroidaceae bacterium]